MMIFKKPWAGLAIAMLLLHLPLLNFSQQFHKRFQDQISGDAIRLGNMNHGTGCTNLRQTSDGGYISVSTIGNSDLDILLTRLHADGSLDWERRLATPNDEIPSEVWPTADSGYIICGTRYTDPTDQYAGLLIKTTSTGAIQWSRTYETTGHYQEYISSMRVLSDGFLLVGKSRVPSTVNGCLGDAGACYDPLLIKTSLTGQLQFHQILSYSGEASFSDVVTTNDGGYLAVGEMADRTLAVKFNSSLQPQWSRRYVGQTFGAISSSWAGSVEKCPGGYAIAGSVSLSSNTYARVYLMHLDLQGNVVWAHAYGTTWSQFARDLAVLPDGFVLAGQRKGNGTFENYGFAVRTDLSGNLIWDKAYGNSSAYALFTSVVQTQDGDFAFGGTYLNTNSTTPSRFLAIKANPLGSVGCHDQDVISSDIEIYPVASTQTVSTHTGLTSNLVNYTTLAADLSVFTACETSCPGSNILVTYSGNLVICGGAPTSITASASGGTAPYAYVWSDGQTGPTASFFTPGTYTVWVEDDNGCVGSNNIYVVASDPPTVNVVSNAGSNVCVDEPVTLSALYQYPLPVAHIWYEAGSPSNWLAFTPSFSPPTNVAGTYNYCVDVYVGAGCYSTACFTLTVDPAPGIGGLESTYCEGEPADFIWGSGSIFGNGTFTSTPPGAVYSQVGGGNNIFWYFDPSAGPGTYTVEYCVTSTGCCASQTVTIVDEPDDITYGTLCEDDPCLDLTTLVSGLVVFSGPGVSGNTFCPAAAGPGIHAIQYCVPIIGNCDGCANILIEVEAANSWPKLAADPGSNVRNERGEALIQDDAGNFYMTGFMTGNIEFDASNQFNALNNSGNGTDLWVVKYNECGVEWAITASNHLGWTAPTSSIPTDIIYDKGRVYVSANVVLSGKTHGVIVALNSADGSLNTNFGIEIIGWGYNNETWANRIDIKRKSITGDPARIYVTGAVKGNIGFAQLNQQSNGLYNSILNTKDIYVAAYTTSGNEIFMTTQGSKKDDVGNGIAVYPNGDVAIIGDLYGRGEVQGCSWPVPFVSSPLSSTREIFVGRYFANGCEDWLNLDGGLFDDTGIDIKLDATMNLVAMGLFQTTDPNPAKFGVNNAFGMWSTIGRDDIFLVRYNSQTGNVMNGKPVNGDAADVYRFRPHSLNIPENQSAVYISGSVQGRFGFDFISNVEQFYSTNSSFDSDPFVMRFQGNMFLNDWVKLGRTPGGLSDRDVGTDVITDASGNAYLTGGYRRRIEFTPQPILNAVQWEDYFAVRLNGNGGAFKDDPAPEIDPVVNKTSVDPAITVYPNPNQGTFKVNVQGDAGENASLRLLDLHGRIVLEKAVAPGVQTIEIVSNQLSAGIYLLEYRSEGSKLSQRVVVK